MKIDESVLEKSESIENEILTTEDYDYIKDKLFKDIVEEKIIAGNKEFKNVIFDNIKIVGSKFKSCEFVNCIFKIQIYQM